MKRRICLLLALLLPLAAKAQVNAIPAAPHLLVRGHAEASYVPDRFWVRLLVQVTDPVPDKARERMETHMRGIFAALDKDGALKGRTEAGTLQIGPASEYRDGKVVFLGTRVNRSVVAHFDDPAKLRALLRDLPAGEEVQILDTGAERSDIDTIRQALRRQAMAHSQEAGRQIASAYGMRSSGVYSVSEVAPDFAYGIRAGSWDAPSDVAVSPPAPPSPAAPSAMASVDKAEDRLGADLRVGTLHAQQDIYAVYLTASP